MRAWCKVMYKYMILLEPSLRNSPPVMALESEPADVGEKPRSEG